MNDKIEKDKIYNDTAVELGFSDKHNLEKYLKDNLNKITNKIVQIKTKLLLEKFYDFSLSEIENNLKKLISIAIDDIEGGKSQALIYIDDKLYKKEDISDFNFSYDFDIKMFYQDSKEIQNNNLVIKLKSYPEPVISLEDAIKQFDLMNNEVFVDVLKVNLDLSPEETFDALKFGGVDNWSGYGIAIELAESEGEKWSELSKADKLIFLKNAGVDNWSFYDESIEDYKDSYIEIDISLEQQAKYFIEYENI